MEMENFKNFDTSDYKSYNNNNNSNSSDVIKKCVHFNDFDKFKKLFLELTLHDQIHAITYCIVNNNFEMFKFAIEVDDFDIHINDEIIFKTTIVHNRLDILKYLLSNGCLINCCDNFAIKALSANFQSNLLEFVIENGANVHVDNDYPIKLASYNGIQHNIILLIQNGADIHTSNDFPFRAAADWCKYDIMKCLLDNGANIHADNDFALIASCTDQDGSVECFKLLLSAGANLDVITIDRLYDIIGTANFEIIQILIDNGIDFSVLNNYNNYGENINVVNTMNLLIEQGLDPIKLALNMYLRSQ